MTSEKLITRAAQMISFGVTVREVTEKFVAEGNSPEASYLAAVAGKLFAQKINADIAAPSNG
jgi:hypothetical protein